MAPGGVPIVGSASMPFVYKVRPGSSGPSALASTNLGDADQGFANTSTNLFRRKTGKVGNIESAHAL
jgi:hypothetical protein